MKFSHVVAPTLAAILVTGCTIHSTHASAPERAEQAEADKQRAQEEATQARRDAEKARLDALDAARVQHEADQKAQFAAQRATLAEHDAQPTAQPTRVGATDRQRDVNERQRADSAERQRDVAERQRSEGAAVVAGASRGISFAPNSADLSADDKARLDETVSALRDHPKESVVLDGYADETGSDSSDADLSRRRADAVAHYLESKGVARDRIATKGWGGHKEKEDVRRGASPRRRVEITIK